MDNQENIPANSTQLEPVVFLPRQTTTRRGIEAAFRFIFGSDYRSTRVDTDYWFANIDTMRTAALWIDGFANRLLRMHIHEMRTLHHWHVRWYYSHGTSLVYRLYPSTPISRRFPRLVIPNQTTPLSERVAAFHGRQRVSRRGLRRVSEITGTPEYIFRQDANGVRWYEPARVNSINTADGN